MPKPEQLNGKALQQLLFYFLQERVTGKNLELKHLIITNCYEWFVFDAHEFERCFANDKVLLKTFEEFMAGGLTGTRTDFFYQNIAKPAIAQVIDRVKFTHFDLRDLENLDLIDLYKFLAPEHLLKLPFVNDSNSLNKPFYNELLYIIGLSETKEGGKKLIGRVKEGDRQDGSLIENAIAQIIELDKIPRDDTQQLFDVALDLAITWVNRILFLKLLEAQLIKYHQGYEDEQDFAFLNSVKIKDYGDLNKLFFSVLALEHGDRAANVKEIFANVPYLNSSLFELTPTERDYIAIRSLGSNESLAIFGATVLTDGNDKKRSGKLNALEYLFEFLHAYQFNKDEFEDGQEDSEKLINASVLGLIFEKINGYKDGSFYTPSFITMYMCRETIRRAVVQKFNEVKGWSCENIQDLCEDLGGYIKGTDRVVRRNEANGIVNSLKICDPAVGSGHFLVSALNEMIAIKQYLGILQDRNGESLSKYEIEVVNDKLKVTLDNKLFAYNPKNKESQRVQETLFHEKQTIIEGCLFGVDINPNSVKICQLRLWIELLKNAYYRVDGNLETLPNIDINIKKGNSLISRFGLDVDVKEVLKQHDFSIEEYRDAVQSYRSAKSKKEKQKMESLIATIKTSFRSTLLTNNPKKVKRRNLSSERDYLRDQLSLFESKSEKKEREKKINKLNNEIDKLSAEIEDIESGRLYENALEWRFEFPEVLNDDGDFIGFDVVIGNPPYGAILSDIEKEFMKLEYSDYHTRWTDTFNYFVGKTLLITKENSCNCLIIPNNFLFQNEYEKSRRKLLDLSSIDLVINLGDNVFDDAEVPTTILLFKKEVNPNYFIEYADLRSLKKSNILFQQTEFSKYSKIDVLETPSSVFGVNRLLASINDRNSSNIKLIDEIALEVANGIQPTGDKIFRIHASEANELRIEPSILKNVLVGSNFNKYVIYESDFKVIYTTKSVNINDYPNCLSYLEKYKGKLESKRETKKGILPWWCLHWARYKELFEEDKIIIRQTADRVIAAIDTDSYYAMNNVIILKIKEEYKIDFDYKFLVGILNSKLIDYIYKQLTQEENRTFAEVKPINIRKLPIIITDSHQKNIIIDIVDEILIAKKGDRHADTSELEKAIDDLVYQLYGLTEEEIKIVEGER
jgi:hypothetical protein